MPPKKKKTLNLVVGTVSTRSTRRQSIVNIDIPKLTRSNKLSPKTAKESQIIKPFVPEERKKNQEFTKKIKKSYNKFIGNDTKNPPSTNTSQDAMDNKALLEILQDWDDEEEDQSDHSISSSTKSDINPILNKSLPIKSNLEETSNISELSENKQMELMLSEGLEDIEEHTQLEKPKDNFQEEDILTLETDENSALMSVIGQTESEDVIIEENASIPFADDMLVGETQTGETIMIECENMINRLEALKENIQLSQVIQVEENISENSDLEKVLMAKDEFTSTPLNINEQSHMECAPVIEEEILESELQESNLTQLVEENKEGSKNKLQGDDVEKMECDFEPSNQASEFVEAIKNKEFKSIDNSGEKSSDFLSLSQDKKEKIYESLEHKVAEMNLFDKSQDKQFTERNVTVLVENIDKQFSNINAIEIILDNTPATKDDKIVPQTQPEAKKHTQTKKSKAKTDEDKKTVKQPTKTKPTKNKPPTFKIAKNKKPKELKSKKKESEKSVKKLKDPDKPETKLTKFEEALQNIGKTDNDGDEVRRSSRIKSISVMNKKTSGWGLVKSKSETSLNDSDISDSNSFHNESDKSTPTASPKVISKDRKCKSESTIPIPVKNVSQVMVPYKNEDNSKMRRKDPVVEARLKQFVHLKENLYKTDRMVCKEAKKMTCDCFLTLEELDKNDFGCGEDCLNKLLFIECGNLCTVGDRCTNKRFQKNLFAPVEVFNTDKKGLGLRAAANIPFGEFILEYVGEVLNSDEFDKRAEVYSQDKNIHYYFMALRADAIIDATMKGNISRFINHSCDPNAETQKWTVNGELRIGFFSTRTILAGEEVTFDYRFQRYGKEAQKCYCGASICRGWLGEQPDSDEEEEEEETEEVETTLSVSSIKDETVDLELKVSADIKDEIKTEMTAGTLESRDAASKLPTQDVVVPTILKPTPVKRKVQKKKPRIEMFEEVDQLNEDIEMLVTTGLKNQAHTLKLSRLMVRAKEPQQRAKLLRVLRRGELPCRRLFLDYHGLRLMHGYMIDAQQLVISNKKFESLRLEMLQTLAVLPIPNKTLLQDSKVLPTVEKWATNKDLTSPADSESNSPQDLEITPKPIIKEDKKPIKEDKKPIKEDQSSERSIEDQEEEIKFLATKLLEEWKNLKEVFRIPKKERIEQMKEHERQANKKFMQTNQNTHGIEEDRKMDRYRGIRGKFERDQGSSRRPPKPGDKPSAEFLRLSKIERRKLFALQHELKEEERKLKQREMWREHEMNCMMIGADPRFTAPFDPSRGYQYIWNQQIGQWQTLPIQGNSRLYPPQPPPSQLPNINLPPRLMTKPPLPGYQYSSPINLQNNVGLMMNPVSQIAPLPQNPIQGHMPPLPQNPPLPPLSVPSVSQLYHGQVQIPMATPPLPQMPPLQHIDEDPSQVKFMGPIPPPAKLPPKWKCAKDKYGRPYYYHIKIRKSQWEPPPPPPDPVEVSESESSSESSTVSSDSSSENSDSDDDIDDTRLLIEVRRQMDNIPNEENSLPIETDNLSDIPAKTPSPDGKNLEGETSMDDYKQKNLSLEEEIIRRPSIDMRLKELDLFKDDKPQKKKRRVGLCEEIIISPRTEEDKKQFKEDLKRYKANKEKLKRQREKILLQTKKQLREIEMKKAKEKRLKTTVKVKLKEKPDFNSEAAKKIKEAFRTNMASTVVSSLNFYRRLDCTEGRITNTQDFKHLARKLTHFVMLKEMKHITKIEDLTCTDNVKIKAREFIRKYMGKFGEVYIKRSDSPDFKD